MKFLLMNMRTRNKINNEQSPIDPKMYTRQKSDIFGLSAKAKYKSFWLREDGYIEVIDQTKLPFTYETIVLASSDDTYFAIKDMIIRGAGVIGNIGAFGVYLAALESGGEKNYTRDKAIKLSNARPTAVNLDWAIKRMLRILELNPENLVEALKKEAISICEEEKENSDLIGKHGFTIIEKILKVKNTNRINILTHCNAGYLAIIDSGSALAPIYEAKKNGIDVHVWVDETRPRNQGSNLTAWELANENIDFTLIADNTGGLLMQKGEVDLVFVGSDRVTRKGDVANKIGTYLKALAAYDCNVPFYALFPSSTFDMNAMNGLDDIEIELRDEDEMKFNIGLDKKGNLISIKTVMDNVKVINYGFDITPSRLITGLITERGICKPNREEIEKEFFDLI